MKHALILLLMLSPVAMADKQPNVVVNVPPSQVVRQRPAPVDPNIAVLVQRIDDLIREEQHRDAEITLLRNRQDADDLRLDKLESEAFTVFTVGGIALTVLLAWAAWSASVQSERHKENRETSKAIDGKITDLGNKMTAVETTLRIQGHDSQGK